MLDMKINKKEIELYLTWGVYLVSYMWLVMSELAYSHNSGDKFGVFRNITFLLFILIILHNKYKTTVLVKIFVFAVVAGISFIFTNAMSFLLIIVVGLAVERSAFDRFVRFDYKLKIAILFSIVVSCKLGLIDNYVIISNGTEKQSLGFSHPNTLGLFVAVIIVEWLYLYYETIQIKNFFCIICIICLLYAIGTSRTSLIILVFVMLLGLLLRSKKIKRLMHKKIVMGLVSAFPAIICSICYFCAFAYQRSSILWSFIDKIFTTRVYWANYYLKTYGLTLFGKSINTTSTRNAIAAGATQSSSFDMAYVRIGVQYGVIILVVFVFALVVLQNYAVRSQNWGLLLANIAFVLFGIAENLFYSIAMNIFLVYIVYAISGSFAKIDTRRSIRTE